MAKDIKKYLERKRKFSSNSGRIEKRKFGPMAGRFERNDRAQGSSLRDDVLDKNLRMISEQLKEMAQALKGSPKDLDNKTSIGKFEEYRDYRDFYRYQVSKVEGPQKELTEKTLIEEFYEFRTWKEGRDKERAKKAGDEVRHSSR
jgi:hypothetical protein